MVVLFKNFFLCIETIGESIFADHRQCSIYNRGLTYSVSSSEGQLSEVQPYIILKLARKTRKLIHAGIIGENNPIVNFDNLLSVI